jgi:hypothetical protein
MIKIRARFATFFAAPEPTFLCVLETLMQGKLVFRIPDSPPPPILLDSLYLNIIFHCTYPPSIFRMEHKKAVALLMGLYKREKFHMYSPALYRLKSRQSGAFLHPHADRSTSAMQNTLMERGNIGGGRRFIHQFHKTVQSQYFGHRVFPLKIGCVQMGAKGGNYF